MFDIGFWELVLVGVVALLVVGPDRLPGLVRSTGMWIGRIKAFVASVRTELDEEISRADELKRLMEQQLEIAKRHTILDESRPAVPAMAQASATTSQAAGTTSGQPPTAERPPAGKEEATAPRQP